jgi:DNA invertase Pin-like site-specific DNA recombinase
MMSNQKTLRAAYYIRISTEAQELDNQRGEIMPFIERRGWQLVHPFEDVMSGGKTEKDRPGFAAMLKAAHQRKFDIVVFWALDRLTREGTRATLNYLQRLESKGVGYVSYQEQWLDSTGPFKDVMISMFATLAKQERARISERTIAGLKVARAKGKRLGRPPLSEETVRTVLSLNQDAGIGARKIAKKHRISTRDSKRNFDQIAAISLLAAAVEYYSVITTHKTWSDRTDTVLPSNEFHRMARGAVRRE